jgi:hypothetical protein
MIVDGAAVAADDATHHRARVEAGRHFIQVKSHLLGNNWRFAPYWNGAPMGSTSFVRATMSATPRLDGMLRGPLALFITIGLFSLVIGWIVAFLRCWRDPVTLGFALIASVIVGWLGVPGPNFEMTWRASWSITGLAVAIALNVPASKQTLKGAFILLGVPWLVFVTVVHASHIGRFSF